MTEVERGRIKQLIKESPIYQNAYNYFYYKSPQALEGFLEELVDKIKGVGEL